MNRYKNTFEKLQKDQKLAFAPFWMIGDPDLEKSEKIIEILAEKADILELGIPFSDPLADGPTIQAAVNRSLDAGTTTQKSLELVKRIRKKFPEKPIGLLVYFNLILQFGIDEFFATCQSAEIDSILIPELPIEEVDIIKSAAKKNNIHLIFLVSTNTPKARRKAIYQASSGFLYTVSTPSITGAKTELSETTLELIQTLKSETSLPIVVGFGISTPKHLEKLKAAKADGGIIGSELINIYQKEGLESLEKKLQIYHKACQ